MLRTLRGLAGAPIEVVEESLVRIAVTSEVCGFGTCLVEFLGVLDGLGNLGKVGCFGGRVAACALTVTLGSDAAARPRPWLAAMMEVEEPCRWGACGRLVG